MLKVLCCILVFFINILPSTGAEKIIFDTDMNGDVDDVGALAVLHALANNGEAEILACMSSNPGPFISECIDVINTYYGRPDIPIGALRGSRDNGYYTKALADAFPHDATQVSLPEPVHLYRQLLAQQNDSSVTIVSVGYLPNLGQLLRSEADEFSPLNGTNLVSKKVKLWVCMGGVFPSGVEHNLTYLYPDDAKYAVDHWPTRIVFTGWEIGKEIMTGFEAHNLLVNSPVTLAYQLYYCGWAFDGNPYYAWYHGHYSWDLTAVLIGVRGYEEYWDTVETGYNAVADDGSNEWKESPDKDHAYVVPKMSHEDIATILDELMNQPPIGAHFYTSGLKGWMPYNVEFTSISNVGPQTITQIQWDLGNGERPTEEKVSTRYDAAGRYPVTLTVQDDAGHSYSAGDTVLVSDPVFSPIPFFGDAQNYERTNTDLWSTQIDQGDLRYTLQNGGRHREKAFDGYSFIKDSVYADFTLKIKVRSGENWQENRSPDYTLVWGFSDENNYTSVQMSTRKTRMINYSNGDRTNLDRSLIPGLADDSYHTVVVSRAGDRLTISVDGVQFCDVQDEVLACEGRIGFGAKDDGVFFDEIEVAPAATGIVEKNQDSSPHDFRLRNHPNPFNPTTTIAFEITVAGRVTLDIYTIAGQKVDTLVDRWLPSGEQIIKWDASGQPSGVYYAVLRAGPIALKQKMVYVR